MNYILGKLNFKAALFVVLTLCTLFVRGQQDPMYTQYMNQLLNMNPAYAGAKGVTSASLIVREQWVGLDGAPSTQTFFIHSPHNDRIGVGGSIINDKLGPVSNTAIFGDYSFTITYPGQRYLSLGLKAGVGFYSANLLGLDWGDELPDDARQDVTRGFLPNAGVGVYFSSPDFYIGIAAPRLIANRITEIDFGSEHISREQIHLFFMGGYVFDLNRILKFKPYYMLRLTPNSPLSFDITAQFVFIEKLWLGATYRFGNSFGAMMQVQLTEQLKVGYAYDLTTSALRGYNSGTHEVLLSFDFSFGRARVRSPRYF